MNFGHLPTRKQFRDAATSTGTLPVRGVFDIAHFPKKSRRLDVGTDRDPVVDDPDRGTDAHDHEYSAHMPALAVRGRYRSILF